MFQLSPLHDESFPCSSSELDFDWQEVVDGVRSPQKLHVGGVSRVLRGDPHSAEIRHFNAACHGCGFPLICHRQRRPRVPVCSLSIAHICALRACTDVLQVAAIENVVSEIDITVRVRIDMAGLKCLQRMKVDKIMSQVDHFVFPVGVPASRRISEFGLRHWSLSSQLFAYLVSDETVPDKTPSCVLSSPK